jgi:glycine oxidase
MTPDVLIVGAGVIGLGIAWRCRQRGLTVTLLDPSPGSGASWTAAGMLAPLTELHYGEESLLALNLASAARYAAFTRELTGLTGVETGYQRCGSIAVAWDSADLTAMRDLHAFAETLSGEDALGRDSKLGRSSQLLTGGELRGLEPALASGLPGGLLARQDHQVDNRLLHKALLAAVGSSGAMIEASHVKSVDVVGERIRGVVLNDGTRQAGGQVVLAAGAWTCQLGGLSDHTMPLVRPVKGQTLRLRLPGEPVISHIIRGSVKGNPVYIVGRADGRLVVGASSEEAGFDTTARAGAVYELLRDAQSLLPVLAEAELEEVSTSLRPGSPDNAPIIGESDIEGLVLATGHYRNGILLTPITADTVAQLLAEGTVADVIADFAPGRFQRGPVLV